MFNKLKRKQFAILDASDNETFFIYHTVIQSLDVIKYSLIARLDDEHEEETFMLIIK